MRIKKFICVNCRAPKINEYKSPYIVCDYCGSFTDIDNTLATTFWSSSLEKTARYQMDKIQLDALLKAALEKKDVDEYRRLQHKSWDDYYKTFPEYLPPSIDTEEKYTLYMEVCVDSSTYYAFTPSWKEKDAQLNALHHQISYYQTKEGSKANPESFFKMAEFYIQYTKDSFKVFYENPRYAIMHELLPPAVHLKMKLSMFVQSWLPYLTESDADRFLKMTGFKFDYITIEKPSGRNGNCDHCHANVFIPEGSYKIYCEQCRKTSKVQSVFKCSSCGAENPVADNPAKSIDCAYCGIENRLITPLFG